MTTAAQIMTRNPTTCREHDTINFATQCLWEQDIGAVPVIDDDGRPTGIITDRDVAMAAYTQGKTLSEMIVKSAMSSEIHTVREDASLEDVQRVMQRHRVRRLPVVDGEGKTVGVLSLNDLARNVGANRKASVTATDVASTLRTLCEPRREEVHIAAAE